MSSAVTIADLPCGAASQPLSFDYFPTRWQQVLWRNWPMLPVADLAEMLQCSVAELKDAAVELGLPAEPKISPKWRSHGYTTIIRNNWHLLPYEQILQLLKWTPAKMAYTLKEEDFLFTKLGRVKPACTPVQYAPLTEEQRRQTVALRKLIRSYIPDNEQDYKELPFAFLDKFHAVKVPAGKQRFAFNFIHSYSANCGDIFANIDSNDPVPENLLEQYASLGIQGIWMHALLYLLNPIPGAEEFSEGYQERLKNLKRVVDRCAKYGLKLYLYLNEPRGMPAAFYQKKPEWGGYDFRGDGVKTICTTHTKEPLQWLEASVRKLFQAAPGLGGLFCIVASENPTNCHYIWQKEKCEYCKDVPAEKIYADIINAMARGMHTVDPDAKMIAYDWGWFEKQVTRCWDTTVKIDYLPFKRRLLDLLDPSVYVNRVSEGGMWTHVGGVEQKVADYSISKVGPSEETLESWAYAKKCGMGIVAKIQVSDSWELSAVPNIPVPYLVHEHLKNLEAQGVDGLMLSWTVGGYPGDNLALLRSTPEELAAAQYHPELAEMVCQAERIFSEAFREYPFNVRTLYMAPTNIGPWNKLYLKPTGYHSTMVGIPYDDIAIWVSVYPEEVFEEQFRVMTDAWRKGLDLLDASKSLVRPEEKEAFDDFCRMAVGAYCHLRTTYLQVRFVHARNNGFQREIMLSCAKEELQIAKTMHGLVREDSRIGFEASNHYYYTVNDLQEKILNCEYVIRQLE